MAKIYITDEKGNPSEIGGGISEQSNWNDNNSSSPNYIQNRPFYEETVEGTTVVHQLDEKYIPQSALAYWQKLSQNNNN